MNPYNNFNQTNSKNNIVAFLLSVIPGLGHLYVNRWVRAILYGGGFFGSLFMIFLILAFTHTLGGARHAGILLALVAIFIWIANMVDMILFLLHSTHYSGVEAAAMFKKSSGYEHLEDSPDLPNMSEIAYREAAARSAWANQRERTNVLLLSFIPGLGHYQLGLMQRGLTAMISFFGAAALICFVTMLTHNKGFMLFLLALPVLWFYSLFDALKQLDRKQAGEELIDQSMFEDFHFADHHGRKNRTLATIIAIFPGASHLYLGMTKRGVQLMALFLLSIYVLDLLRLSFFLFMIPLLWFFSFFDALQQISKYENGTLADKPLIENWLSYSRSIGAVLIVLGAYYLFKEFIVQILYRFFPENNYSYWISGLLQTSIVTLILLGAGIRLLFYRKKPSVYEFEEEKKNP